MSDENENESPPTEAPPAPPAPAPPAPAPSPPPGFSQEEVNNIVARELAKQERKLKKALQPQQQETTIDIGQSPAILALAEQIKEIGGLVKGTVEKAAQSEKEALFAADTAGLTLSDAKKKSLMVLQAHPDLYAAELAELKAKDSPPAPKGPGFNGTGAPNAVPNAADPTNPQSWSADEIASMRANGTFLSNLKAYRTNLPGGSGGLFPLKSPKGKKS